MNPFVSFGASLVCVLASMAVSAQAVNSASKSYVESYKLEFLGSRCDAGYSCACRALSRETNGQCASPNASYGCRFDSLD